MPDIYSVIRLMDNYNLSKEIVDEGLPSVVFNRKGDDFLRTIDANTRATLAKIFTMKHGSDEIKPKKKKSVLDANLEFDPLRPIPGSFVSFSLRLLGSRLGWTRRH